MNGSEAKIEEIVARVSEKKLLFEMFRDNVVLFFEKHPALHSGITPSVHSVKSRLKDHDHLRDKLRRKISEGRHIEADNVFQEVTDIAGVRVLHLYQRQLSSIHNAINQHVRAGEWVLAEEPKAYSWDPEASDYFNSLGLKVEIKESYYTSVHYLVRPREDAPVCCEIQVRTLFEEIWGEIDHAINYPKVTESIPLREQLRVLAKLVGTGSRLADAIFTIHSNESTSDY